MVHPVVEDLINRLRDEGQRVTTARRLTLDALVAAGPEHLSAEQLAQRVQRTHPELHVSTIYRTLEFFEEQGIVTRAGVQDGAVTYHLAHDHHHHAVCDVCGTSIELPDAALRSIVHRLEKDHGFAAEPRHLIIGGRCQDCR